jgi:hypothetical protein
MPALLKYITAHAFACVVFLIASVVPHHSFAISGRSVSYAEWWSSGAGALASLLGVILPISGYLLLSRHPKARITYLVSVSISVIGSFVLLREPTSAAFGVALITFGMWYLYRRPSVVAYFASNNRWSGP